MVVLAFVSLFFSVLFAPWGTGRERERKWHARWLCLWLQYFLIACFSIWRKLLWQLWIHLSASKLTLLFSDQVMSDFSRYHGLQHTRLSCPSLSPGVCPNSCPLNWWCHPTISSSVVPFSSHLQSFLASRSFPVSQLIASGAQSIGVSASASVLAKRIQGWLPLRLAGLISLLSKGLSRVFSRTTVQKHQFFKARPSSSLLILF